MVGGAGLEIAAVLWSLFPGGEAPIEVLGEPKGIEILATESDSGEGIVVVSRI